MSSTAVEQIKERLSIIDVISAYVELHKAGKSYKGKSPFTSEKTPSFYVSPDRGMYYCFSSNQGGDMFTFIEKMEGVDFKGALKILADKAGVELVPEDPKKRDERDTQYAVIEEATKYFFKNLSDHPGVGEYVSSRGVEGKTIHTWRIGFAIDAWRSLREHLTSKGFSDAEMLRAGLIKRTEDGKEPYDVFRNRVMFPIADNSGRVVAFSGRTLAKDAETPKYVNSPETELYVKSDILFGYDKAKHGIRQFDFSLLVEGQFDLVLAHQAGYINTVAVSGTALTEHHVALLQRLSNRAVLALDSDRAGIAAVKRSSSIMLKKGMDVKVVHIEGGKDPADIIREDAKLFKAMVGKAMHVIEFLLMILKKDAKDERNYKLLGFSEVIPLIKSIPNYIDRDHFEGVAAIALGTTKEAVHAEVMRLLNEQDSKEINNLTPKTNIAKTYTTTDYTEQFFATLNFLSRFDDQKQVVRNIETNLKQIYGSDYSDKFNQYTDISLNRAISQLEEQWETFPKKSFFENLANDMVIYFQRVKREKLNELKEKQRELEKSGLGNSKSAMELEVEISIEADLLKKYNVSGEELLSNQN